MSFVLSIVCAALLAPAMGGSPVIDGTHGLAQLREIQGLVGQGRLAEAQAECRQLAA